jgi:lysozyme family protein
MPNDFEAALKFILKVEGGFSNHVADTGGATMRGIIQRVYDRDRDGRGLARRSVRLIEEGEVRAIYLQDYWLKGKCDRMPWPVSLSHFDACVNTGITQAGKLLQRAIGAKDDGIVGPMTLQQLDAVCEADGSIAVALHVADMRRGFYSRLVESKPDQRVFLRGWFNRVQKLEAEICPA